MCVSVGLGFVWSSLFLASGPGCWGACPLVCPTSVFRHPLGGRLRRGGVPVLPWVVFAPPPSPFGLFGGGASWRVLSWLCGVGRWLSRSWVSWSPSPLPLRFRLRLRVFFFLRPNVVCVRVRGVPSSDGTLLSVWCRRFWLGSPPVPLRGVPSSVPSGWRVWLPRVVGGRFCGCGPFPCPPPPGFLLGGVCLFLPLPSLGWCTKWSAFIVVNRVAVGACVVLGLAPAPRVGWVMYTLGSAALPAA